MFEQLFKNVQPTSKRPLVLLVDDLHLLKHARTLVESSSAVFQQLPANVFIIYTTVTNAPSVINFYAATHTIALADYTDVDLIDCVKRHVVEKQRKLTNEQLSAIKQSLTGGAGRDRNPLIAQMLADEMLSQSTKQNNSSSPKSNNSPTKPVVTGAKSPTTKGVVSNEKSPTTTTASGKTPTAIDARLGRMESLYGRDVIATIAQYLAGLRYHFMKSSLHVWSEILSQIVISQI